MFAGDIGSFRLRRFSSTGPGEGNGVDGLPPPRSHIDHIRDAEAADDGKVFWGSTFSKATVGKRARGGPVARRSNNQDPR